ncbi:MAG: C-terminal helicase domain-containing protein, partial [Rhodobacter sp.]|nr:C-terminal helicase domain-containing protein [Rhodobacter sp.]
PLTPEEFKLLQAALARMRMTCDTPYILDPKVRDCPKLEELERVLEELLEDPERKILVFSEWVRMLELVRERLDELEVDFALHTGSVPQDRRRTEIARFKQDPGCRLFLSSESGGTGLNLQVANAVINLDLPWNPAKLEQRIARAWRKHQKRSVSVLNFVTRDSIEHRMLGLLETKQALADTVLDERTGENPARFQSGRAAGRHSSRRYSRFLSRRRTRSRPTPPWSSRIGSRRRLVPSF